MATEYKLSYTAKEIDEKLGKVGEPVSWNDLEDKPFSEELTVKTVEVEGESDLTLVGARPFKVGEVVNITIDGIEYSLTAYEDGNCATIGDKYDDVSESKGEFGWTVYVDGTEVCVFSNKLISVSYIEHKIVKQLDPRFMVGRDVLFTNFTEANYNTDICKCDKTSNEIYIAVNNSIPTFFIDEYGRIFKFFEHDSDGNPVFISNDFDIRDDKIYLVVYKYIYDYENEGFAWMGESYCTLSDTN